MNYLIKDEILKFIIIYKINKILNQSFTYFNPIIKKRNMIFII